MVDKQNTTARLPLYTGTQIKTSEEMLAPIPSEVWVYAEIMTYMP